MKEGEERSAHELDLLRKMSSGMDFFADLEEDVIDKLVRVVKVRSIKPGHPVFLQVMQYTIQYNISTRQINTIQYSSSTRQISISPW